MPLHDEITRVAIRLERPPLLEASLARIYHHFKNTPMGVNITAFRSNFDEATNKANMQELERILKLRYGFIKSRGPWVDENGKVWPAEPGFTVPGLPFRVALALARKSEWVQDSFFWTDGRGHGSQYDTQTGKPRAAIPMTQFHVFARPEDIKPGQGGTIPTRAVRGTIDPKQATSENPWKAKHSRGFSIMPRQPIPESYKQVAGISWSMDKNMMESGSNSVGRFLIDLPMKNLYLVEFDLSGRSMAMLGMGRVTIGTFAGDQYLWLANDGTVSVVNEMSHHILRMAPLMELKE